MWRKMATFYNLIVFDGGTVATHVWFLLFLCNGLLACFLVEEQKGRSKHEKQNKKYSLPDYLNVEQIFMW